jgi:hypothetical protein
LTPKILENTKQYRDRFLALERYLGTSITTKSHLAGYHSVEQHEDLKGVGDLGKDFGEQKHQDEAKADVPHIFPTRETIKSKEEVQTKDQNVQANIIQFKTKRKRGPYYEGTEARKAAKKQQRLEAQGEILASLRSHQWWVG